MITPENVVIVADFAHVNGGAGKVAIDSAIGLAARGVCVHFLAAVSPIAPSLVAAGVDVVCLNQHEILNDPSRVRAAARGIWNRTACRRLAAMLDAIESGDGERQKGATTLVHFHQWSKALSPGLFRVVHDRAVPYVVTFHDYFISCPNGAFFNHPKRSLCFLRPMSLACAWTNCDSRNYGHKLWRLVRQQVQMMLTGIPEHLEHGIYLSDLSRRALEPHLPATMRWHFVMNPIEESATERIDVRANRAYVFVGRFSPEKGALLFAQAARKAGVEALFVGDGPERSAIEAVNPDAVITGWLDHGAVPARMKNARALVFPSVLYESQPLTIWTAKALGLPAIVSDVCAAADAVGDRVSGLHFPSGRVGQLAAKLRELEDDDLLERLSRAAYREYWDNPPSVKRHVDALMGTYAAVIADNGAKGSYRRNSGSDRRQEPGTNRYRARLEVRTCAATAPVYQNIATEPGVGVFGRPQSLANSQEVGVEKFGCESDS